MNKIQLHVVTYLFLVSFCLPALFGQEQTIKYSGGKGKGNNPYKISNSTDLTTLGNTSNDWGQHFVMTNDIDMSGATMKPIGSLAVPFSGKFDGHGYSILNLTITGSDDSDIGLFGVAGAPADKKEKQPVIQNLGIINPVILFGTNTPELLDPNDPNTDFLVDNDLTHDVFATGGLVAFLESGLVRQCSVRGNASSSITGHKIAGGLIGEMGKAASVENSYSGLQVISSGVSGGLIGIARGHLEACYSTGSVSGVISGGSMGFNFLDDFTDVFWDTQASQQNIMYGRTVNFTCPNCNSLYGKTTNEMQTQNTFPEASWDFNKIWNLDEQEDYPRLFNEGTQFLDLDFVVEASQYFPSYGSASGASGTATFRINTALLEMQWTIICNNIQADAVELRGPATVDQTGIVMFDLLAESDVVTINGTATTLMRTTPFVIEQGQLNNLLKGEWYVQASGDFIQEVIYDPMGALDPTCRIDPNIIADPNGGLTLENVFDPNGIIRTDILMNSNNQLDPNCVVDASELENVDVLIAESIRGQALKRSTMTVDKLKVKADAIRTGGVTDSIYISGQLYDDTSEIDVMDVLNADSIFVDITIPGFRLIAFELFLNLDELATLQVLAQQRLVYPTDNLSLVKTFVLDFKKNRYVIEFENINLIGLSTPFECELSFGLYSGLASVAFDEDLEIGKAMPLCLQNLFADDVRVDKVKGSSSSLNIQGRLSAIDPAMDLNVFPVTVSWGDFSETILSGGFVKKGKGRRYSYKKPKSSAGNIQKMDIDFDKCLFKCSIKGATGLDVTGEVTFNLKVNATTFDESDTYNFD